MSRRFVTDEGIRFEDYGFAPASVFPEGLAPWREIAEADPDATPPEIRLRCGEVLFASAEHKADLRNGCRAAGVPEVSRVDVWALLLEPYLDTQLGWSHKRATMRKLRDCGIPRRRVWLIRQKVSARMRMYNTVVLEWIHLGLCDLLDATLGSPYPPWMTGWPQLRDPEASRFYWWAMDIAK